AGLTFDLDATLEEAGAGNTWNPVRMVRTLVGAGDVQPALEVDRSALLGATKPIAAALDEPAVEPRITFENGKPKVREPADGLLVDRRATADLIRDSYLVDNDAGRVPTETAEPTVGSDQVDKALSGYARPAVAGPVRLTVGHRTVSLGVDVFAPALTLRAEDGELTPVVDPARLEGPLERATRKIGRRARDATVRLRKGRPRVVPARAGAEIEPADVAKALVPVLPKSGAARRVTIDARTVEPEFSTKDAKALGIKEKISAYHTSYPHATYRNVNQGRAAELIDGTVLKPGETFSFNDTVGERTRANGFTKGTIISGGVFREELGGGVSQVATTMYNAAFFAGLKDVEHKPHSFYISRYPVGREATVAWPSVDLSFTNDTGHGVLIHAWIDPSTPRRHGSMNVEMWGTKTWRIKAGLSDRHNSRSPSVRYDPSDHCVPQSGVAGFDVDVYRTFVKNGERVRRETTPVHYDAADTVRCRARPDDRNGH
ncbi:MAG: VanW family protein, partial [Nocardioidaceae bacterium]